MKFPASSYSVGVSHRTVPENLDGPLRHAITGHRRTPTGKTWAALCGAGVYLLHPRADFDPGHPRACLACRAKLCP